MNVIDPDCKTKLTPQSMLAQLRRGKVISHGRIRQANGRPNGFKVLIEVMRYINHHAPMMNLRFIKRLFDVINQPDGDFGGMNAINPMFGILGQKCAESCSISSSRCLTRSWFLRYLSVLTSSGNPTAKHRSTNCLSLPQAMMNDLSFALNV